MVVAWVLRSGGAVLGASLALLAPLEPLLAARELLNGGAALSSSGLQALLCLLGALIGAALATAAWSRLRVGNSGKVGTRADAARAVPRLRRHLAPESGKAMLPLAPAAVHRPLPGPANSGPVEAPGEVPPDAFSHSLPHAGSSTAAEAELAAPRVPPPEAVIGEPEQQTRPITLPFNSSSVAQEEEDLDDGIGYGSLLGLGLGDKCAPKTGAAKPLGEASLAPIGEPAVAPVTTMAIPLGKGPGDFRLRNALAELLKTGAGLDAGR